MEQNERDFGGMNPTPVEYTYGSQTGKRSPFADSPYDTPFTVPQPQQAPQDRSQSKKRWVPVVAVVSAVVILVGGCSVTSFLTGSHYRRQMQLMQQAVEEKISVLEAQLAHSSDQNISSLPQQTEGMTPGQVYSQNARTVVAVFSRSSQYDENGQMVQMESSGSGFIMSADGYVVTNHHVIDATEGVLVKTYDGQEYDAEVIGSDAANDIALLKIDGTDLPFAQIGSSDQLAVGDQVIAVGHPLGNKSATLTVGYVSAKDQNVHTDGSSINMIQTDAAINSGNSGGPLFNTLGQVVGITTAKYSGYSSSGASIEGIGYAIPIDDVVLMLQDLKDLGYVKSAYLGVMVKDVDPAAQSYGLPAGAFVESATSGFAADRAGIEAKDIIVEVGGYDVTSVADLTRALRKFGAGETVVVTVWRGSENVYISVTLDEKPDEKSQPNGLPMPAEGNVDEWFEYLKPFFEDQYKG